MGEISWFEDIGSCNCETRIWNPQGRLGTQVAFDVSLWRQNFLFSRKFEFLFLRPQLTGWGPSTCLRVISFTYSQVIIHVNYIYKLSSQKHLDECLMKCRVLQPSEVDAWDPPSHHFSTHCPTVSVHRFSLRASSDLCHVLTVYACG